MADASGEAKTYTQEQVDALIKERNEALEAKRDEILGELKDAKTKLKAYDGLDPAEHRKLVQRVQELEQERKAGEAGVTSEQLTKIRSEVEADIIKRFSAMPAHDLAKKIPAVADLVGDNRALRLDSVVKAEMAKAGVRGERVDALFRLTADRFDLTDDGKPMLKTSPGMEIPKFVGEDLKKEYPEFFNGTGSSGGGASKSAGSAGGHKTIAADDMDAFMSNVADIATGKADVVMS